MEFSRIKKPTRKEGKVGGSGPRLCFATSQQHNLEQVTHPLWAALGRQWPKALEGQGDSSLPLTTSVAVPSMSLCGPCSLVVTGAPMRSLCLRHEKALEKLEPYHHSSGSHTSCSARPEPSSWLSAPRLSTHLGIMGSTSG